MRKVPLKSEEGEGYYEHIRAMLNSPPTERGYTLDEMRQALRVIDALDEAENGYALMEEADFQYLCERVKTAHYKFASKNIIEMVEDILSAKEGKAKLEIEKHHSEISGN